jgi:hypothetical protein
MVEDEVEAAMWITGEVRIVRTPSPRISIRASRTDPPRLAGLLRIKAAVITLEDPLGLLVVVETMATTRVIRATRVAMVNRINTTRATAETTVAITTTVAAEATVEVAGTAAEITNTVVAEAVVVIIATRWK